MHVSVCRGFRGVSLYVHLELFVDTRRVRGEGRGEDDCSLLLSLSLSLVRDQVDREIFILSSLYTYLRSEFICMLLTGCTYNGPGVL